MKYLLPFAVIPLLCSCQILERLNRMETIQADQVAAIKDAQADGVMTEGELEAIGKKADAFAAEIEGLKGDIDALGDGAEGFLGHGAMVDQTGMVALGMGLLHYIRNRKYKQPTVNHGPPPTSTT